MEKGMMEMFQLVLDKIDTLDKKVDAVDKKVDAVDQKLDREILSLKIQIENDVTKRIDSLFDGYKLVHEKQWELEHKLEAMERRLAELEARAG